MNSLKTFRRTLISVLFVVLTCSVILFVGSCDVVLTPDEGKTGKSAYDIWLDNGYEGSETDFLEWLRGLGTRGEKGDTGAQGEQGIQGEKGEKGDKGEAGKDGVDGKGGTDGKSAYEIAVALGYLGTDVCIYALFEVVAHHSEVLAGFEQNALEGGYGAF